MRKENNTRQLQELRFGYASASFLQKIINKTILIIFVNEKPHTHKNGTLPNLENYSISVLG